MEKKNIEELKIYSEFFTNGAVAWFSAGVIGPLFSQVLGSKEIIASSIAIMSSFIFLQIAVRLNKYRK